MAEGCRSQEVEAEKGLEGDRREAAWSAQRGG